MRYRIAACLCFLIAANAFASVPALADPPCGRGWRKHETCGPVYVAPTYIAPGPVFVAPPPPVVYVPAPVYALPRPIYAAPPPVYVPAPVSPSPPSLQLGVSIPLH